VSLTSEKTLAELSHELDIFAGGQANSTEKATVRRRNPRSRFAILEAQVVDMTRVWGTFSRGHALRCQLARLLALTRLARNVSTYLHTARVGGTVDLEYLARSCAFVSIPYSRANALILVAALIRFRDARLFEHRRLLSLGGQPQAATLGQKTSRGEGAKQPNTHAR